MNGPGHPATCRACGAAVYRAQEVGVRVAMPAMWVDAAPVSPLLPLGRAPPLLWEHHPRLGWVFLDHRARRGYPLHQKHQCKYTYEQKELRQ